MLTQLCSHKVAKVDQMETAIGKSMRERNDTKSKADKVIRRELTSVLTAGTLVDAGLLTNDLSTYCMSIKVSDFRSRCWRYLDSCLA